jgi:hypothetical protein
LLSEAVGNWWGYLAVRLLHEAGAVVCLRGSRRVSDKKNLDAKAPVFRCPEAI